MMPSSTSTQPNQPRRKTALVLAGGGITGFLYEVGVLTALDELAGRALSNDFDVYVGTSAGAVLAALLANGAHAAEIFAAMTQNEAGSPFYFRATQLGRPDALRRRRQLQIDNNGAEQALRPIVLGRKNWFFAGSEVAAHRSAILCSLVHSCTAPADQSVRLSARCHRARPTHPARLVLELTPREWKRVRQNSRTQAAV